MDNKIYQIFISSTYSDLHEERRAVAEAISKSGQIPAGMEYFPASSQQQFEYIKRIIDRCDYYVLLIAGKYGSLSPSGISFTEEEYRYAVSKGIPVLAFLHRDTGKIASDKVEKEPEKLSKLESFRTEVSASRIVDFWDDGKELPGKVTVAVTQEISLNPKKGWVRGDTQVTPELLIEIANLREQNQELKLKLDSSEKLEATSPQGLEKRLQLEYEKGGIPSTYHMSIGNGSPKVERFSISVRDIIRKLGPEFIRSEKNVDMNYVIPYYKKPASTSINRPDRLTIESKNKIVFALNALNIARCESDFSGVYTINLTEYGQTVVLQELQ